MRDQLVETIGVVDVARARRVLRHKQQAFAQGLEAKSLRPAVEVARERATQRRAQAQPDGEYLRFGPVRYLANVEHARWARTVEIIERADPGPFEDGGYVEFLARQAATIELTLLDLGPELAPWLDRIVFGTTGEPKLHPTTTKVGSAAAIAMAAGEVELLYQVAKAVVLSWKPLLPPPGSAAAFSGYLEDTIAVLDADGAPVRLITETLRAWLFDGRPRPFSSAMPPAVYHWPLTLLSGGVERFVLAHEYAHALLDHLGVPALGFDEFVPSTSVERELRADAFATAVVCSSATIDGVGPNMALQGALLAMRVHEATADLVRMARQRPTSDGATHPPLAERTDAVIDIYSQLFDDGVDVRLSADALAVPLETFDVLWERAVAPITTEILYGRPLHPIWEAT